MTKPSKLSAETVQAVINEHDGNVRFGAYIVARGAKGGRIEAKFLSTNNTWSNWIVTSASYIATQCYNHGIDSSMIVRQ